MLAAVTNNCKIEFKLQVNTHLYFKPVFSIRRDSFSTRFGGWQGGKRLQLELEKTLGLPMNLSEK